LALQHRVWRSRALDAWRRAGFARGQTLLDIGCGPGFAALDLAEIVGPRGRVLALDRSRRFLDALAESAERRGLANIETIELDLDGGELPRVAADGAWGRWVFAFLRKPRELLERVAAVLRPGAALVHHEYFDYTTWRLAPRSSEHEEFVRVVMESWRASGGEPEIALELPRWLGELGLELQELRPLVDVVTPADPVWQWPASFVQVGLKRLVELGRLTPERSRALGEAFLAAERRPRTLMFTPAVLEIVARRP
jgi:SAM-dependent methyltransferase